MGERIAIVVGILTALFFIVSFAMAAFYSLRDGGSLAARALKAAYREPIITGAFFLVGWAVCSILAWIIAPSPQSFGWAALAGLFVALAGSFWRANNRV
jgi:hypothetical protein